MPRNMKLQVMIVWADDGKPVMLDGKPLMYTEKDLADLVEKTVEEVLEHGDAEFYTPDQMKAAIEEAFEAPKVPWWKPTTTTAVGKLTEQAMQGAVADALENLRETKAEGTYKSGVALAAKTAARKSVEKVIRKLKEQTLKVFGQ